MRQGGEEQIPTGVNQVDRETESLKQDQTVTDDKTI